MVKWIVVMKIQPSICLDDWGKPRKTPSQVGRHRDSNPRPPECECRALLRRHLDWSMWSCFSLNQTLNILHKHRYKGRPASKERFRHVKIFFYNNTETEYASFGTYLCLLFHIVAFDFKAFVPWHQFMYTLFVPCGHLVIEPASFRTSSFAKRLPARCAFIFGNRKKSDSARSALYGGCSNLFQWNYSRSKACVWRTVCGHALSSNRTIPRESLPLGQDNLRSHRPAENE